VRSATSTSPPLFPPPTTPSTSPRGTSLWTTSAAARPALSISAGSGTPRPVTACRSNAADSSPVATGTDPRANAKALAEGLMERGFHLVSGGTDNHLLLVDLRKSHGELTGKDAEAALEHAGMTVNKNTVPGETRSPFVTSGLRIGTSALTTRGVTEPEMALIAGWIAEALEAPADEACLRRVRGRVTELCEAFPLYPELAVAR